MYEQTFHEKLAPPIAGPLGDGKQISLHNLTSTGVLVLVEGVNDVEFLRRIGRILHLSDPVIPDLNLLEQAGRLVFIPFGGGGLPYWSRRLEAIGWAEFHLYDRELPPETEIRRAAAKAVNARPRCQAAVTRLRSLENYLHPLAIKEVKGIEVEFAGMDSVADVVAKASLGPSRRWETLSKRAQRRMFYRIKKWLNTTAVDRMTSMRLAEQDSTGEVSVWLRTIATLATGQSRPPAADQQASQPPGASCK